MSKPPKKLDKETALRKTPGQTPQGRPSIHNQSQVITQELLAEFRQHSGPLPDPKVFAEYEQVLPGSCERILKMAEENSLHIRTMEKAALQAKIDASTRAHTERTRGQLGATISVILSFGVAAYALYEGNPSVAGVICSVTVVGLVGAFITNKVVSSPSAEKNQKQTDGRLDPEHRRSDTSE